MGSILEADRSTSARLYMLSDSGCYIHMYKYCIHIFLYYKVDSFLSNTGTCRAYYNIIIVCSVTWPLAARLEVTLF